VRGNPRYFAFQLFFAGLVFLVSQRGVAFQWGFLLLEFLLFLFILALSPAIGPPLLIIALLFIAALWAWRRALAYARAIDDTPIARVTSTAQGYAGLLGHGRLLDGAYVREPYTGRPCLWYRRADDGSREEAFQRMKDQETGGLFDSLASSWQFLWLLCDFFLDGRLDVFHQFRSEIKESDASFLLEDGSGEMCIVDPEGAEMLLRRRIAKMDAFGNNAGKAHYWSLRAGEQIYVLGEFVTKGSITPELDTKRQVGELLESWKKDRAELLRRFDLNGDGQLSLEEWDLARTAARQEVEREQRELLITLQAHLMRKPRDKRLYLISNRTPTELSRQFWLWAIVHGTIFIAAAAALAWFYGTGDSIV
jgi:hypothetical protein